MLNLAAIPLPLALLAAAVALAVGLGCGMYLLRTPEVFDPWAPLAAAPGRHRLGAVPEPYRPRDWAALDVARPAPQAIDLADTAELVAA